MVKQVTLVLLENKKCNIRLYDNQIYILIVDSYHYHISNISHLIAHNLFWFIKLFWFMKEHIFEAIWKMKNILKIIFDSHESYFES